MPTIQELIDSKVASSSKQGLIHSLPEYGELTATFVDGNKLGAILKVTDDTSAVAFALIKMINALNDVIRLNEECDCLQTIKRVDTFGYCRTLENDLPLSSVVGTVKYMVKRSNTVMVGKTGKQKRRTKVKFLLPSESQEEAAMTRALYMLDVRESNGCEQFFPIITGEPVCSVHRSEAMTSISVEI